MGHLKPGHYGGNIGGTCPRLPRVAPMPLTATAIRNAKPHKSAWRLFDALGLYLEISPAGGRWWRLKYRHDGKEKRLSLGVYPPPIPICPGS